MDKHTVAARVKLSRIALLKLLLFAILAWLTFGIISFLIPPLLRWLAPSFAASIEPGTFGDMFGAGNAFFSALAFGAVAYTLWLQTQELEEARQERREARDDSKENLKHQKVIAFSQARAAEMQLKVAQSGDAYAAFARIAGSEFAERLQRIDWLVREFGIDVNEGSVSVSNINFQRLASIMDLAQRRNPPKRYSARSVSDSDIPKSGRTAHVLELRVIEDIQKCVSALVDLRPPLALQLIDRELLKFILNPFDYRFIAGCAKHALVNCEKELLELSILYNMIFDDELENL